MPNFPPIPYSEPTAPLPPIDVSCPDTGRSSFLATDYDTTLPLIRARFPNIDPLYLTKIFRGTIHPEGLIWLDVDRQDASPPDFSDLAHLLYCFEIYGQILCILADPQAGLKEIELQRALSDYKIRLLKLSKVASFESLREWHKAFVGVQIREGQDRVEGWRERREGLAQLLKRKVAPVDGEGGAGGRYATH
ncbi:hypothetical protein MMC28_006706 [Mycoblastus sanguinarius]|nr:hypothetical protein [Mycoblastus sanguinarius]